MVNQCGNRSKKIEHQNYRDKKHARIDNECSLCGKRFKNIQSHSRHCGKQKRFGCKHCPYRTKYKHALSGHIDSKHRNAVSDFKCRKCGRSCLSYIAALRHEQFCGEEKRLGCAHCLYVSKYRHNLLSHLVSQHSETKSYFECGKCGNRYQSLDGIKRHEVCCGEENRFGCAHCLYSTKDRRNLLQHLGNKHTTTEFICGKCEKRYQSAQTLKRHKKSCDKVEIHCM